MKSFNTFRALLGSVAVVFSTGCAVIVDRGEEVRDYYVIGYARLRMPKTTSTSNHARVTEITGIGVAVSHYVQLGYFKEFQATLKPETNSAVVILRSDADVARLEALLKELNLNKLCLIIKDERH